MRDKFAFVLNIIQTLTLLFILIVLLTGREKTGIKQVHEPLEAHYKTTEPIKLAESDAIWGSKDAPNTLVAFVDYECPFCKDLYKNIKEIEKDYITTGKVKVVFRDLPLKMHKNSQQLAAIMECARQQGKFWELADLVLSSKEKYDSAKITEWSVQLDLDAGKMEQCSADKKTLDAVFADIKDARSRRITGTPAVFINDVYYKGTIPVSDLRDIFDGKKVERKQKSGSCGQK